MFHLLSRIVLTITLVVISVAIGAIALVWTKSYLAGAVSTALTYLILTLLNSALPEKIKGWPKKPIFGVSDFLPW